MERRRIGDEGNRSTCVSGPLPRSVYFLIGYSGLYIVVSPRAFSSSVLPPLSVTPSPHHSFLISHFSDPVMSKGVEGGGSSAASALKRQRRGFRGCRRMIRGGLGKGRLQWWRGFPARGDSVSSVPMALSA